MRRWLLTDPAAPWIVGGMVFVGGYALAMLAVLIARLAS